MKPIQSDLSKKLLQQDFSDLNIENLQLKKCQQLAENFVELENGIAVLSDLQFNKSYVYSGKLADELGVFQDKNIQEIESIWEEELFAKLEIEDVLQKHLLELQFFQFIKTIPSDQHRDYCVVSRLRIAEDQKAILHKMFYFTNATDKNVELALCLYHFDFLNSSLHHGMIINTANGSIIHQTEDSNSAFLSIREKEILKLIKDGKRSKEIAELLFISINTVNRHRQNILEKMRVGNTTEACTMATKLKWI
ncbi:LuxR C-terminal-related transcriptional regulator [Chryseobacterium wangxinyae]|uniref:response regulator transcription factor n=1 Tax=Chryseobacterium sp. CY350 TaxID=2997336 RepID=UPI00226E4D8C|nr:LuxR C-terminal-related transcriptional regulator [Chryseobacterium sp. CY350]MCY0977000.1 LuxR C-terminal-related transcriptional regulator [Chryseobacterium sp. CY350]WBZ97000.1 LuxR C-terminal-related transcriptional regulator [Chryseobacterium sp. CY350]